MQRNCLILLAVVGFICSTLPVSSEPEKPAANKSSVDETKKERKTKTDRVDSKLPSAQADSQAQKESTQKSPSKSITTVCPFPKSPKSRDTGDYAADPKVVSNTSLAYVILCPTETCGSISVYQNSGVANANMQENGTNHGILRYNPSFIGKLEKNYGPGAAFGVLAHEVGHHIDCEKIGFENWSNQNPWKGELTADWYCGFCLAKSFLGTKELENAMRAEIQGPSGTHPDFDKRYDAVRKGYFAGGGIPGRMPSRRALMR